MFALGLEPTSGPGLIFATLPKVFAAIPAGWLFGLLFFVGLLGAGYLSDVARVRGAGRRADGQHAVVADARVVWLVAAVVFVLAIPPMINNAIFVPWDLTFGSGMQTLGALVAAVTVGWCDESQRRDSRALSRRRAAVPTLALPLDSLGDSGGVAAGRRLVAADECSRSRHAVAIWSLCTWTAERQAASSIVIPSA